MERLLMNSLASRVIIFALVMILVYWAWPDSGVTEFKKMNAAMQNARSWRMETAVTEPTKKVQSTLEVYCPSRFHEVSNSVREEGGSTIEDSSESYWIEGTGYSKKGTHWVISQEQRSHSGSCAYGPRRTDELLERLDPILILGKIRKGETRFVDNRQCRDWIASVRGPSGWREEFGVCIGDGDLPLEVFTPDRRMVETYTDWNASIRIEAPITLGAAN
jgi:hypothetical protein